MVNVHQAVSCALVRPDSRRRAAIEQLAACRTVGREEFAVVVDQLRQGEGLNSAGCSTELARDPVAGYAVRRLDQASSGVCVRSRRAYRPQAIRLLRPIHSFDQEAVWRSPLRTPNCRIRRAADSDTMGYNPERSKGGTRPLEGTDSLTIGDLRGGTSASRWRTGRASNGRNPLQPYQNNCDAHRIAMHFHLGGTS
jgi:hypothetical protein